MTFIFYFHSYKRKNIKHYFVVVLFSVFEMENEKFQQNILSRIPFNIFFFQKSNSFSYKTKKKKKNYNKKKYIKKWMNSILSRIKFLLLLYFCWFYCHTYVWQSYDYRCPHTLLQSRCNTKNIDFKLSPHLTFIFNYEPIFYIKKVVGGLAFPLYCSIAAFVRVSEFSKALLSEMEISFYTS